MRKEIRLSGFGGQGIGLAGHILGKAAALYQGLEAVMTQSYGPEARGGASSANIVIADRRIDYPFVQRPDVLVALSQEAYTRFRPQTGPDTLVIIDEGLVTPEHGDAIAGIPATRLAEELGRRIVANMVMLGFFASVSHLIDREALEKAIETTVPAKTLDLNLKAFATGFEYENGREPVP